MVLDNVANQYSRVNQGVSQCCWLWQSSTNGNTAYYPLTRYPPLVTYWQCSLRRWNCLNFTQRQHTSTGNKSSMALEFCFAYSPQCDSVVVPEVGVCRVPCLPVHPCLYLCSDHNCCLGLPLCWCHDSLLSLSASLEVDSGSTLWAQCRRHVPLWLPLVLLLQFWAAAHALCPPSLHLVQPLFQLALAFRGRLKWTQSTWIGKTPVYAPGH